MGRCDSGDVTGNVPHCRRWIDSIRSEIDPGQTLQEINCAALRHARVTVNHDVFAQPICVYLIAKHGQRDSRVALNVPHLLMVCHVADTNSSFSIPTHTTVTCGLPSALSVVK